MIFIITIKWIKSGYLKCKYKFCEKKNRFGTRVILDRVLLGSVTKYSCKHSVLSYFIYQNFTEQNDNFSAMHSLLVNHDYFLVFQIGSRHFISEGRLLEIFRYKKKGFLYNLNNTFSLRKNPEMRQLQHEKLTYKISQDSKNVAKIIFDPGQ